MNTIKRRLMVAFVGVSGAGKTTLMRAVNDRFPHNVCIVRTVTSREPRDDWERKHIDFVSVDVLDEQRRLGELVQYQVIYGNIYALTRKNADQATDRHIGLICLDHDGADQIRSHGYDVRVVVVTRDRMSDDRGAKRRREDRIRHANDLIRPHSLHLHNYEGEVGLAATVDKLSHFIKQLSDDS